MQKLSLAFFWWQFSFHFIYVLNRVYLTMITSLCWGTLVPRGEMHAVNNTAPAAIFSTHLLKYYNRLNLIMAHTMAKNNKSLTITNNYTVAIANIPCDISSIVCFFAVTMPKTPDYYTKACVYFPIIYLVYDYCYLPFNQLLAINNN